MSKRPTLISASSVPSGYRCRALACRPTPWPASRRQPGRLAQPRRNSASRRPRRPPRSSSAPLGSAAAARAASAARALREAQEPRFKLDESGALVPDVRAEAAIIYDPDTGQVLWESNSQNQRSIASITKVMTAVVFLENSPDLSDTVVVERVRRPRRVDHLSPRRLQGDQGRPAAPDADRVRQRRRARAGPRVSPYGSAGFIERMNEKAKELGLTNTQLRGSVGPARRQRVVGVRHGPADHLRLRRRAHRQRHAQAELHRSTAGRRMINIHSTNQLVMRGDVDVQAGKTGFISNAGYCLATLLRLPQGGRRWRSSCSARSRTPAASGKRATCSTGSRPRRRICSAARRLKPRN